MVQLQTQESEIWGCPTRDNQRIAESAQFDNDHEAYSYPFVSSHCLWLLTTLDDEVSAIAGWHIFRVFRRIFVARVLHLGARHTAHIAKAFRKEKVAQRSFRR